MAINEFERKMNADSDETNCKNKSSPVKVFHFVWRLSLPFIRSSIYNSLAVAREETIPALTENAGKANGDLWNLIEC